MDIPACGLPGTSMVISAGWLDELRSETNTQTSPIDLWQASGDSGGDGGAPDQVPRRERRNRHLRRRFGRRFAPVVATLTVNLATAIAGITGVSSHRRHVPRYSPKR